MTKPKTLEQLRADKERAETQLAQEQHKLERLENRQSQAQIGVISAPICAFCRHSLGRFFVVSDWACLLFSCSGSKWVRGCNIRRDWRTATLRHSPHDLSSYHKWRKGQRFVGVFVHHGSRFGLGDGVKVTTVDILIRCDGVAPW